MQYDLDVEVILRPIWHHDPPQVVVSCSNIRYEKQLTQTETFHFVLLGVSGPCRLAIDFVNKTDADTVPELGLDKAVAIERIGFFGITDPRFVWQGGYRPTYPEPWASQQRAAGVILPEVLSNTDRLSWNGTWQLDFDLPVFTWIHRVQNLGWIFD